ncbi:hypothetical protein LCGC14_1648550 [marine sediment metagenome]|uniref:Uncharacterized protein n=1 Tax=marine sediment metagenome TaxID=412755 RepID=A0A0F9HYD5_9ZZZZ
MKVRKDKVEDTFRDTTKDRWGANHNLPRRVGEMWMNYFREQMNNKIR